MPWPLIRIALLWQVLVSAPPVKGNEVGPMTTSRCLVAILVLAIAGCTAPPAQTAARRVPLVVSALTVNSPTCAEVDAYSATCVGN
jgi:hypothetical protein